MQYNGEMMIREFLLQQADKGNAKNTLRAHRSALLALHRGCNGIPDVKQIRRCLSPTMNSAYYNKRLSIYKRYFDMLIALGHMLHNPLETWHYKKVSLNIKNYEDCKVREFLNGLDKSTFAGLRDYIICLFIIDTGIRPNEVMQILKDDVNMETKQVYLRREVTKTGVARTVPVSDYVLSKVQNLHQLELEQWCNPYLFCTAEGAQMSTISFRHNLHKVALKTGIDLTPYDFRHIFATTYIRNGGDVFSLQRIMGHSKPSMTMIYVNLNSVDLSVAHRRVNVLGNFVTKRVHKI